MCGTMVRKERAQKGAKKQVVPESRITRSKSIASINNQFEFASINIQPRNLNRTKKPSVNISTRVTRSNSMKSEKFQSERYTLPIISPKRTRSKSQNIQKILINSDSSEPSTSKLPENIQTQSKSSDLSLIRFVKLHHFKVDSIVLAKQKWSIPWPAKVLVIEKKRTFVYFFGDKRNGYVENTEIYDYILSTKALKSKVTSKKTQRTFLTGIAEIELLLDIPSAQSLLNEVQFN